MDYDVIIIGGGPAGLTAGIYAARGGLNALVVYANMGGQAALSAKIENFSGIPSIDGFSLTYQIYNQAAAFGVKFEQANVTALSLIGKTKTVTLDNGKTLTASAIILATGTTNRKLGLPNEENLFGKGISYCATCDGNFFRGKAVAVNGGGNTALSDALYLSNIATEVYLVHRRQNFRAESILVKQVLARPNIKLVLDSTVVGLEGEPLNAIKVKNVKDNTVSSLNVSGLFVAIGSHPNSDMLNGQLAVDCNGYIITDDHMLTNLDNVYAVGDVRVSPLRQIITACADGAIAGNQVLKSI